MIFFQVKDITKAFSDLRTFEANGWKKLEPMQTATKSITKAKVSICKKVRISMYTFGVSLGRSHLLVLKRGYASDLHLFSTNSFLYGLDTYKYYRKEILKDW